MNVVFRHNNPSALADSAGDMYEIIIAVFNGKGNSFLLLCVALCSFIVLIIVMKNGLIHMGNFDLEGYFIWDLQKYIEEFILRQLSKRGLAIEDRTLKINRPDPDE